MHEIDMFGVGPHMGVQNQNLPEGFMPGIAVIGGRGTGGMPGSDILPRGGSDMFGKLVGGGRSKITIDHIRLLVVNVHVYKCMLLNRPYQIISC